MEAESGSKGKRPIVVDFLATLFITFCIGVAASLTLVGSVILMAGDARGAEPSAEFAPMQAPEARGRSSCVSEDSAQALATPPPRGEAELRARIAELTLAHQLATRYANLIAMDRAALRSHH